MNHFQRLKDIREDRNLKQSEVAQVLQIGQSDYSKYERGVNMMGIDKYIVLARFYNVSLDYLAGLINTPRTLDGKPYKISNSIHVGINTGNIKIENS